ncbi:MAG: hypothetical protein Q8N23_02975 [Archangium sp.]|nr:hypothetical protein [Archangium sp.]MDP3151605.1 hypothetical protein [Archangium sp.]MDP3569140.1 hypothetical protein [Archangium sp.]
MAGKKTLESDAEVKAAVDSLLGQFGVVGEADGDFDDGALPVVKNGERADLAPSGEVDALWGGKKK